MSAPRLVLKQSTGWFAAGWQFGEALRELSDAAFKLFAWLCLNADRHTGQARITVPELSEALRQPLGWTEPALQQLVDQGVCRWAEADVLEVHDRYWPYEKQTPGQGQQDYLAQVRRILLAPACVRSSFTPADEHLALDLCQRGVTVVQLQRAIWLGCTRKYIAMLNGQPPMPITSLRYFAGLVDEVRQPGTPDSYWEHVRRKTAQLERQWLSRTGPAGVTPTD
jgi:hypothetical protein